MRLFGVSFFICFVQFPYSSYFRVYNCESSFGRNSFFFCILRIMLCLIRICVLRSKNFGFHMVHIVFYWNTSMYILWNVHKWERTELLFFDSHRIFVGISICVYCMRVCLYKYINSRDSICCRRIVSCSICYMDSVVVCPGITNLQMRKKLHNWRIDIQHITLIRFTFDINTTQIY